MKFLSYVLALAIGGSIPGAIAQTNLNDNRPPIAQVNPQKPIQIRVINQSSDQIVAVLTEPASADRQVGAGQDVTFGRLNRSYLPLPIDLIVYTERKNNNLKISVAAIANEVVIRVNAQPDVAGATSAVYIDPKGNIFLY